jgi:hypothetical protein
LQAVPSRILIAPGARKAEEFLMEEVRKWTEKAKGDLASLGRPLRIVVPSRSLRDHVAATLVSHIAKGLAGVKIQTLYGLASEILQRAGKSAPRESAIVEILIRRAAEEEEDLARELRPLEEGMGAVVGTVVDLIEAGMDPAHVEALEDLLEQHTQFGDGDKTLLRAKAIFNVAAKTLEEMERLDLGLRSSLFQKAKDTLGKIPDVLPTAAIFVHGFADATGLALDFLEVLLKVTPCTLIVDHPAQPGEWTDEASGCRFTQRLLDRLSPHARMERIQAEPQRPNLRVFRANGQEEECFLVATLIQQLILSGCKPEKIGVVTRQLEPYSHLLRCHLSRLAIPFSGVSSCSIKDPTWRIMNGFLELSRRKRECPTDSWLELLRFGGGGPGALLKEKLILGLKCLGAPRLGDVAVLNMGKISEKWQRGYPLPFTSGLEEGEEGSRRGKKFLAISDLEKTIQKAKEVVEFLDEWSQVAGSAEKHSEIVERFLTEQLGWKKEEKPFSIVREALSAIQEGAPGSLALNQEEFLLLMAQEIGNLHSPPLGGKGGGVQVLDVMEARSRTFEHLFLLGLNRNLFPRVITEDPILPDSIRYSISTVLPDIPIKERGFDEENYLFAQLVSSSPNVTLSFLSADDDGKAMAPSPFLERLRLAQGLEIIEASGILHELQGKCLIPATQRAKMVGTRGGRAMMGALLSLTMEENYGSEALFPKEAAAKARLRILNELDPDLRTPKASRPGPYMGFLGAPVEGGDPRGSTLYVTTLEKMAGCPWLTFLQQILRVEAPQDPFEAMGEITPAQIGILVHKVLEGLVVAKGGGELPKEVKVAVERDPIRVPWPTPEELEEILRSRAQELLLETGGSFPLLLDALVKRVRPYLDMAMELEWGKMGGEIHVLGVELEGAVEARDGEEGMALRFRADRADLSGGQLILTDYKTGQPIYDRKDGEKAQEEFADQVAQGKFLQAVAYALAQCPGKEVVGRYIFLNPDLDPKAIREYRATSNDQELISSFQKAVGVLHRAWRNGIFFPRLVIPEGQEEKENRICRNCDLFLACSKDDSGFKARILNVARESSTTADDELVRTFSSLWSLRQKASKKGKKPDDLARTQG